MLTGKYLDGVPDDSRAALPGYEWLRKLLTDQRQNDRVRAIKAVAEDLGVPITHLALAWCVKNPNVSTVITGASKVEQVVDNMAALDVLPVLTDEVMARLKDATR
jgi:aryl-alcohol dehydrogenase-like predicted oxidoreductase